MLARGISFNGQRAISRFCKFWKIRWRRSGGCLLAASRLLLLGFSFWVVHCSGWRTGLCAAFSVMDCPVSAPFRQIHMRAADWQKSRLCSHTSKVGGHITDKAGRHCRNIRKLRNCRLYFLSFLYWLFLSLRFLVACRWKRYISSVLSIIYCILCIKGMPSGVPILS